MFSKQVGDFGDFEGFFRALERLKSKIRSLHEGFGMRPPISTCFSGGVGFEYHCWALFRHFTHALGHLNGLYIPPGKGISYFGKLVPVCSWGVSSAVGSVVAPYQTFPKLRKTQRCSSGSYTEKKPEKVHDFCSWAPVQNSLGCEQ